MARRGYRTLPVGGEYRAGDPAKIPDGQVARAENVFVRPGRYELRDGWREDADGDLIYIGLCEKQSGGVYLGVAADGKIYERTGIFNEWVLEGAAADWVSGGDHATFKDTAYIVYRTGAAPDDYYVTVGWNDGLPLNVSACQPNLAGGTVCEFQRRIFMGDITERIVNELTPDLVHSMETTWTSSLIGEFYVFGLANGYQRMEYVGTGTSQSLYRDVFVMPADGYIRWQQTLVSAWTFDIPLTLTIEDSAGKVYATLEVTLDRTFVSGGTDVQSVSLEAQIPSGKTVRLRFTTGNRQIPHPTSAFQFYVSSNGGAAGGDIPYDLASARFGPQVTLGRYPFPYGQAAAWDGVAAAWPSRKINRYPYRVMWSETDDPTWWRGINYYDVTHSPGPVTAVRPLAGRLTVHKNNGLTILRSNADADNPVQFEEHHEHVGAVSCRAIDSHEGVQFFVGQDEVYRFAVGQLPEPFAGPAEREFLFPATAATVALAIDPIHREISIHARSTYISIYNYEINAWAQLFVPNSAGANQAVRQFLFGESSWQGRGMLVLPVDGRVTKAVSTDTVDTRGGVTFPVTGRIVFPAVETDPPTDITLERAFMKHRITTAQNPADEISFAVSFDGGVTYPNYNDLAASPLSTGGVTVLPPAELDQTGPRVMLMIQYTGRAGKNAFNFYGGWIVLGIRGAEVPNFDAVPMGDNL